MIVCTLQIHPHEFLIAAATNYYTRCALNQHDLITLLFWMSEVQDRSHWAKIKVLSGLHSFRRLWGESVSLPFQASRSCSHSLPCVPHYYNLCSLCRISSEPYCPVSPISRTRTLVIILSPYR